MKSKKAKHVISLLLSFIMVFGFMPSKIVRADETSDYSVTFDLNYVDAPEATSQVVTPGSTVNLPGAPTREGYIFAGWYIDPEGGQYKAFNAATKINESINLYARWIGDDDVNYITTTEGGKTVKLGYSTYSGIKIRKMSDNTLVPEEDLLAGTVNYGAYKDLSKNGEMDPYENWTLELNEREADLANRLSVQEIAGLMLYSGHQTVWTSSVPTQAQVTFLANDDLRHVLIAGTGATADIHAKWNNNIQAMTESFGYGIPANNSSDPRHSAAIGVEFYSDNKGTMSLWPTSLGLAATFDPNIMLQFAKIASAEYRAFGISTALSPQIDISTDPRWNRTSGTFGEDPKLSADMTKSYVAGFQGTYSGATDDANDGGAWGKDSVNAMIKHWPGGGGGEAGRDAHSDFGKYSVYPGGNFEAHIIPFVDGALQGEQGSINVANAVMPYYTISNNIDPTGTDVANAFSKYMITDLLRGNYGFKGVICTDWGVDDTRGWGPSIEPYSRDQRSTVLIDAGINQFGGTNTTQYVMKAYNDATDKGAFEAKMAASVQPLLHNIFVTGLFEDPYLDVDDSVALAKNSENKQAGFDAQVKSVVMLKNHDEVLPLSAETKVYVPKGSNGKALFADLDKNFVVVDTPQEADVAIVPLGSPTNPGAPDFAFFGGGWLPTRGYFPLTLQYSPYTAVDGRDVSIAGDYRNFEGTNGNHNSKILNRTYKDKTVTATNFSAFQVSLDTKEAMGNKPVITVLNMDNPPVFNEIDAVSDAVLVRFASSDAAVNKILSGESAPTGLLPLQIPNSMAIVEKQFEDLPRDMECYVDKDGNIYDFAYGLTWEDGETSVINDDRVETYKVEPMTKPANGNSHVEDYVTIKTVSLPVAKIGEAYNATIETKESGTTIMLQSGNLPAGLSFDNGIISGTPTAETNELGEQLVIKASADGKEDRIYRITLLANATGTIKHADPNELSIAITLANAKKEANYTSNSWIGFAEALTAAKAVYNDAIEGSDFSSTQAQIDNAKDALNQAMDVLVRMDDVPSEGFAITFNSNGGNTSSKVVYTNAEGIIDTSKMPADPIRIGYTFMGWYTNKEESFYYGYIKGESHPMVDFTKAFAEPTTVYAAWQASASTIVTKDGTKQVALGYSDPDMLIYADGSAVILPYTATGANPIFKDLNRNGALDVYEDWRLSDDVRANDLVGKIMAEDNWLDQVAGLMLYSSHQIVMDPYIGTAQQKFLKDDYLRHVLIMQINNPVDVSKWNNNVQAYSESIGLGIPANNSSDPRHGTGSVSNLEYTAANTGVSAWPSSLGLAATFNPSTMKLFGKIASVEYRLLGIATALSPQIDIATDPRWNRFSGTFGEDPKLASEMAKAYVDGFQTTYANGITGSAVAGGWGSDSVNAMMKHWPGGGAGEGGRDAHYEYGKYATYPGGNFNAHLIPFVDGSLSLDDGTEMATAVMPYYTISYMQQPGSEPNGSSLPGAKLNVGNAYNNYMINDLLRDAYNFNGVVCTDWNVIGPMTAPSLFGNTPGMVWGIDDHYGFGGFDQLDGSAIGQRARMLLDAGVDQMGGLNSIAPIKTAYNSATAEDQVKLKAQFASSAKRLLMNIFKPDLFENPYVNIEKASDATTGIGGSEFKQAGYKAQLDSMVLLKNVDNLLPLSPAEKIYAPGASDDTIKLLKTRFADASATNSTGMTVAIAFIKSPVTATSSDNTYNPVLLDFASHTATMAPLTSVAGRPLENGEMENRSYNGKTVNPSAAVLADKVNYDKAVTSGLKVVVSLTMTNPMVFSQIEPSAKAILVNFEAQNAAILDMLTGKTSYSGSAQTIKPMGMLPMQMPLNMNEVDLQYEDVPRDMVCYTDKVGNTYDFGFGLTYGGTNGMKIDAIVNSGFKTFVTDNATATTEPDNKGTGEYSIANRMKVTFDYGYKELHSDKENKHLIKIVQKGSTVTTETPVREGAAFEGWFTDKGYSVPFNFDSPINENTILYAKWASNDYQLITKVLEYGQDVVAIAIDAGEGHAVLSNSIANDTFKIYAITKNGERVVYSGPRTITKAYVNVMPSMIADSDVKPSEGRYIILELQHGFGALNQGASTLIYTGGRNVELALDYTILQEKAYKADGNEVEKGSLSYTLNTAKPKINLVVDDFVAKVTTTITAPYAMRYMMYTPETSVDEKVPLVLWLHGGGEGGNNMEASYNGIVQILANMGGTGWVEAQTKDASLKAFIVAPQSYSAWDWRKPVADRVDSKLIDSMIKEVIATNPNIDTNRIYVAGCSMGGGQTFMQLIYSKTHDDAVQFAAALPICPAYSLTDADAAIIKDVKMRIVLSADDTTVSPASIKASYDKLIAAGSKTTEYKEYEKVISIDGTTQYNGHWSWVPVLNNDGAIMNWLFSHNSAYVPIESVKINNAALVTVKKGKTVQLNSVITPSNATNQNIVWSSSNANIAVIDQNGKVTAKAVGIVIIQLTVQDKDKKYTSVITVRVTP